MFKASKKLDEPPKVMSMAEIQEDLETFSKPNHKRDPEQIVEDLRLKEDLNSLNLSEWWDGYEVNEIQIKQMEQATKRLNDMKHELKSYAATEIEQRRIVLLTEIDENLQRLRLLKTPK